ncbi:MAG TPA: TadE family protein [Allosphingosinicella sp.]|jgi:Flp pilus assembly protein TadG|nr:TadE family protein [Allosphingosinicella sp.]
MLKTRAKRARTRVGGASLRGCTSGVAMMEFALALPVVMALGLMGLETANYAMAHLRVSNIAMLTADNAGRVRDSIDEADVVELFTGAKMSGANINFAQNGRIILSDLEPTGTGTNQWIRWQRCDGALNYSNPTANMRPRTAAGAAITNGTEIYNADRFTPNPTTPSSPAATPTISGMGATTTIAAQSGSAVMVVEVVYTYQPIIPNSFLAGRQIRYESAFNVRQRSDQTLRNVGRITPRSCNTFAA